MEKLFLRVIKKVEHITIPHVTTSTDRFCLPVCIFKQTNRLPITYHKLIILQYLKLTTKKNIFFFNKILIYTHSHRYDANRKHFPLLLMISDKTFTVMFCIVYLEDAGV